MAIAKNMVDYTLYLVTDRRILLGRDLYTCVEEAIQNGVTAVQLREKNVSGLDFYQIALKLKKITVKYNVPLIINDRLDIALAVDADGLHIGQEDLPVEIARRLIGPDKILGYSVSNIEEALRGEAAGADYLGVGAVYHTNSKLDAGSPIGPDGLRKLKQNVNIPIVGIGGINETNISEIKPTGIAGIAVISAILGRDNIAAITRELVLRWKSQL
ncbi:thiamine phosphate synthase [Desulfolucanica intricata]|uniref:thiamine phosphate synthase n=1 Tax=Desulfolucanica intricata TaxID=1285191 RepID=UPI000AD7DE32|nr:thiamine phosphate synthase [Desulfolucanica intricata]